MKLDINNALKLYQQPLPELMYKANEIRQLINPGNEVTWIIDRNVNITNICKAQCTFCNFCRTKKSKDAYVTTIDEYRKKIEELFAMGGNQLLLQGGLHPDLGLDFYVSLFKQLKKEFPELKLHALSPPEIYYLSEKEGKSIEYILKSLINAGLDSLPGAGAEILSNRVRKIVSPAKCSADAWLEVMKMAHHLGLITSATMMFGHVETIEERLQHLLLLRELQNQKPDNTYGFLNFVLWPVQLKGTRLSKKFSFEPVRPSEYIRMLSVSRIILDNIPHIQPSWLTVGKEIAQVCLHAGADDMGSIMIEENVVSATGAEKTTIAIDEMKQMILEAGFIPRQRNQKFEKID
ncbi:MAG: cyclic dehypoxanthinyl futalosine synthase [Bacteroidales bacterium]